MKKNEEILLKLRKKEKVYKKIIVVETILMIIVIVLIGIGIFSISKERKRSCNNLSEVEIQNFNEKFISFVGTNVRGREVNSLLNRIVQNNVANQYDTSRQVKLTQSGDGWQSSGTASSGTAPTTAVKKAQTGKTYKVEYTVDDKTGLVSQITIESN